MSASRSIARLPFRPLSNRWHCRFASNTARPQTGRSTEAATLANDLLSQAERALTRPRNATTSPFRRRADTSSAPGLPSSPRTPARFADLYGSRARSREAEELAAMNQPYTREELERMSIRKWELGDVIAPHDLSGVEMNKWKKPKFVQGGKQDVLDRLGIDPMREYKNFSMMAEFVTETGRIKPRSESGLRLVNQRKMARAIRRAIGSGLMPRTYKHPELLKRESDKRRR